MNYKQDAKIIIELTKNSKNKTDSILKSILEFSALSGINIYDVRELVSNIIDEIK